MAIIDFSDKGKATTILQADSLNVDLLRLLTSHYIVVVEQRDNHIIYELYDKDNHV